jgi:energy-coupling factor transporter transmembrane protein EcfT
MADTPGSSDVEQHLLRREAAKRWTVAVLLAVGLPALLFGPVILSSIYWFLAVVWGIYFSWSWAFLGSLVVLVPLLFWTEWKSGGSYYASAVLSSYGKSDDSATLATGFSDVDALVNFAEHPRDPMIGLVELFLWGPRQVLEAFATLRDTRQVAGADRHRAAEILTSLQLRDHADLRSLVSSGQAQTGMAVAYLIYYDWVGISADKSRIWIESASRQILVRA